jgi:hypothetical protein
MNPQFIPVQAVACGIWVHWLAPPHWLGTPPPPQVVGDVHCPHWTTSPQPLAIGPHAFAGHVVTVGVQPVSPPPPPQTFGCPPPPQTSGAVQPTPQPMVPPQPSAMLPQFMPAGQLVIFVQLVAPHWFGVPPPPQIAPPVHLLAPQSTTPPQPSATSPHSLAPQSAGVLGVQVPPPGPPEPHTLGVPPPPHVCGEVQLPQLTVTLPQPSGCGPHFPRKSAHVFGVQVPPPATAHLLGPPPPQNSGATQPPQLIVLPQPSLWRPQSMPWAL